MNDACSRLAVFAEPPTANAYRQALLDMLPDMRGWVGFAPAVLQRRIDALIRIGRHDLGLARLAEGHLDALSILDEAGMAAQTDALYGIWASGGPADSTSLNGADARTLTGSKPFCSGAGLVDRALIWIGDANELVEVDLASHAVRHRWDLDSWGVGALAGIQTWTGLFDRIPIEASVGNGDRDWYFERAGFWLGALCPAACWAGGAMALVEHALAVARDDPISHTQLGRMLASAFAMESALHAAARPDWGDLWPGSADRANPANAQMRALAARHLVERAATQIIDEFGRLLGPRPLIHSPSIARRIQELQIYLRQCHGDRDLAELASKAVAGQGSRSGLG